MPCERDRTKLQDARCEGLHEVSLCLDQLEAGDVSDVFGALPMFCAANLVQIRKIQLKIEIELLKLVSSAHIDLGAKQNRLFDLYLLLAESDQKRLGHKASHFVIQVGSDQVVMVFYFKLSRCFTLFGLAVRQVGNVRPRVLCVILLEKLL